MSQIDAHALGRVLRNRLSQARKVLTDGTAPDRDKLLARGQATAFEVVLNDIQFMLTPIREARK